MPWLITPRDPPLIDGLIELDAGPTYRVYADPDAGTIICVYGSDGLAAWNVAKTRGVRTGFHYVSALCYAPTIEIKIAYETTLERVIHAIPALASHEILSIALACARAIDTMHAQGFAHGALYPRCVIIARGCPRRVHLIGVGNERGALCCYGNPNETDMEAIDWHSYACMIFELVTGKLLIDYMGETGTKYSTEADDAKSGASSYTSEAACLARQKELISHVYALGMRAMLRYNTPELGTCHISCIEQVLAGIMRREPRDRWTGRKIIERLESMESH